MTARPEDTVRGERIRLAIQRTEVAEGDSWREDAVRELDALLAELAACRDERDQARDAIAEAVRLCEADVALVACSCEDDPDSLCLAHAVIDALGGAAEDET